MTVRNKMMLAACAASIAVLASGCSGTEKAEGVAARMEAAQMMGRNDAKRLLTRQWSDSSALDTEIDSIKAGRDRWVARNPATSGAYDSTYLHTVKAVDPLLYRHIRSRLERR